MTDPKQSLINFEKREIIHKFYLFLFFIYSSQIYFWEYPKKFLGTDNPSYDLWKINLSFLLSFGITLRFNLAI